MSKLHDHKPKNGLCPGWGSSRAQVDEQARTVAQWVNSDLFRYTDCEGFQDGAFGLKAGPAYGVSNLLHEIAHCVQLSDRDVLRARVYPSGWGLTTRKVHIPGYGTYTECETTQCSEREAEVFAIQMVLAEHLFGEDREEFITDTYSLFTWLPDYLNLPSEEGHSWNENPGRNRWIREHIREMAVRWSDPDHIRARFLKNLAEILKGESDVVSL